MSSTIEFRRFVLKAAGVADFSDNFYIGFGEMGESNVIDSESNKISRDWSIEHMGSEGRFMRETIMDSISCESGMLKMNGRWCKPEGYISAWRKSMQEAVDIEHYLEHASLDINFRSLEVALNAQYKEHLSAGSKYGAARVKDLIIELLTHPAVVEGETKFYGSTKKTTSVMVTHENWREVMGLIHRALQSLENDNRSRSYIFNAALNKWSKDRAINTQRVKERLIQSNKDCDGSSGALMA